jgi:hypothetical protein
MGSHFYRVVANPEVLDPWFLGEPLDSDGKPIDARSFVDDARPYDGPLPIEVPIKKPGRAVEFGLEAFDMPVVADRIAAALKKFEPVQIEFFPVRVGCYATGFQIVNVISAVECIDERRTNIMWWKADDGRPDKTGKYRMITNLTLNPSRCDGHHIFRIKGWEIALIVSEPLKQALEAMDGLGVTFLQVTH